MHLMLVILHSEDHFERASEICLRFSPFRVMAFEGSGVGRTTARKLFSEPSFSPAIWKHLETKRQKAWVGFALARDIETVHLITAEIELVAGDLSKPRTGIVAAMNISVFNI